MIKRFCSIVLVLAALLLAGCASTAGGRTDAPLQNTAAASNTVPPESASSNSGVPSGSVPPGGAPAISVPQNSGTAAQGRRVRANTSYAIGMWMGMVVEQEGLAYNFDYTELLAGIRDAVENRQLRMTTDQAMELMQTAYVELFERRSEENRAAGEAFLAQNVRRRGVTMTASGLQYEAIVMGTGPRPARNDKVRVNYELSLIDGKVLSSSFASGEPAEMPLAEVIDGWSEGLQLMPVGSTFMLYLPPALGYGESGGAGIPPNATLIFKVELLSILPRP